MSTSTSAPGSWAGTTAEQRRADRRARLLDAGLDAFGTEGYAASSINRICKLARVTERDLYREFGGKRGLFLGVYEALIGQVMAEVTAALDTTEADAAARVRAATDAFTRVVTSDPRLTRINFIEVVGADEVIEERRRQVLRAFGRLIDQQWRDLAASGAVHRGPVPGLSMALVGATQELLVAWVSEPGGRTRQDVVEVIVRVHLAVMRHA